MPPSLVLDDFSGTADAAHWRMFSDRVMGGISTGAAALTTVNGGRALRLTGTVSLENNGGFVQVARAIDENLLPHGDASAFAGLVVTVCGAPGTYFVHLRTADARLPWQYYAAPLPASPDWADIMIPWSAFVPKALRTPLDTSRLRQIGLVAAGMAFNADLAVTRLALA
jgi:Complex I intermediate-associated protein 30 (CIA30)